MKNMLFKFDDVCKELGIKYYLLQGTCLGFYRDHGFIPGDLDIDLFVDCDKEKIITLFKKLEEEKLYPKDTFSNKFKNAPGEELNRHVLSGGNWIDVYFKMLDNRKRFMIESNKVRFEDRTFNCPFPVEDYLTLEFGEWQKKSGQKSRGHGSPLHEQSKQISFDDLVKEGWDSANLENIRGK